MTKITKTTFKSFLKKNSGKLYIHNKSSFDGMVDGTTNECDCGFNAATPDSSFNEHQLGYREIWLVGMSRDYFRPYNDGQFQGIEVYNCCGHFIVATQGE